MASRRWASIFRAPVLNLPQMMNHKTETVAANVGGVDYLFKKNKITTFRGIGSIAGARQGAGDAAERADHGNRDQEYRHRFGFGFGESAGHRDRREDRSSPRPAR